MHDQKLKNFLFRTDFEFNLLVEKKKLKKSLPSVIQEPQGLVFCGDFACSRVSSGIHQSHAGNQEELQLQCI